MAWRGCRFGVARTLIIISCLQQYRKPAIMPFKRYRVGCSACARCGAVHTAACGMQRARDAGAQTWLQAHGPPRLSAAARPLTCHSPPSPCDVNRHLNNGNQIWLSTTKCLLRTLTFYGSLILSIIIVQIGFTDI